MSLSLSIPVRLCFPTVCHVLHYFRVQLMVGSYRKAVVRVMADSDRIIGLTERSVSVPLPHVHASSRSTLPKHSAAMEKCIKRKRLFV